MADDHLRHARFPAREPVPVRLAEARSVSVGQSAGRPLAELVPEAADPGAFVAKLPVLAERAMAEERYGLADVCWLCLEALRSRAPSALANAGVAVGNLGAAMRAHLDTTVAPHHRNTARELLQALAVPELGVAMSESDSELLARMLMAEEQAAFTAPSRCAPAESATMSGKRPVGSGASPGTPAPSRGAGEKDSRPIAPETIPGAGASADAIASNAISSSVRELLDLLRTQVRKLATDVRHCEDEITGGPGEARLRALHRIERQLAGIGHASSSLGLHGVSELMEVICAEWRPGRDLAILPEQVEGMGALLHAFDSYFEDPLGERTAGQVLAALPAVLGEEAAPVLDALPRAVILEQMSRPAFPVTIEAPASAFSVLAAPGRFALDIPADADHELVEALMSELPQHASELGGVFESIADGSASERELETAQRITHTIKGAAATVGVTGIATLSHLLEEVLLALLRRAAPLTSGQRDLLVEAGDCLESMIEAVQSGRGGVDDTARVAHLMAAQACALEDGNADITVEQRDEALSAAARAAASSGPSGELPVNDAARAGDVAEEQVRLPGRILDELLELSGEGVIVNGQLCEELQVLLRHVQSMREGYSRIKALAGDLEKLIDLESSRRSLDPGRHGDEFDPLELEHYSELYTCGRRLAEAAVDTELLGAGIAEGLRRLDERSVEQSRLQRETQQAVLHTRMVSAQVIVGRLQRTMRQAMRLTGKRVAMEISGAATTLDNQVLAKLVDPLMHIIRNAVDHGIEPAAERLGAGKSETGRIHIAFRREGASVSVQCSDDGRGFDLDAIATVARNRGLIAANEAMDESELLRFVLLPSFSTRARADAISGRGVGLDVVHASVRELGGIIELNSTPGAGARIHINVPVTHLIAHTVIVHAGGQQFAIAERGVSQVVAPAVSTLVQGSEGTLLEVGGETYERTDLEQLLGLPITTTAAARRYHILVRTAGKPRAVAVESIEGTQDVILKDTGRYIPRMHGIAGMTILNNGAVTPLLDLPDLLDHVLAALAHGASPRQAPLILVADDSLSSRRALSQLVTDAGYDVMEARDGIEAVEMSAKRQPALMLLDLEMPRMNGIEVTRHVRADALLRRTPVVMVTSRSTEHHRGVASASGVDAYITKPFSDDSLLDTIVELLGSVAASDSSNASSRPAG